MVSKQAKIPKKTYNSRDSLVVTHPTTNLPISSLCMAERTGCPVFLSLWSYVTANIITNVCIGEQEKQHITNASMKLCLRMDSLTEYRTMNLILTKVWNWSLDAYSQHVETTSATMSLHQGSRIKGVGRCTDDKTSSLYRRGWCLPFPLIYHCRNWPLIPVDAGRRPRSFFS